MNRVKVPAQADANGWSKANARLEVKLAGELNLAITVGAVAQRGDLPERREVGETRGCWIGEIRRVCDVEGFRAKLNRDALGELKVLEE